MFTAPAQKKRKMAVNTSEANTRSESCQKSKPWYLVSSVRKFRENESHN